MGLMDLFRKRKPASAAVAKERLLILVAQERAQRGGPDYLPLMQREILEVIRKYVQINNEDVQVRLDKDGDQDVLELNVVLPDSDTER
ncbi:MAG: cell division topological specificity factor MinE [Wenzhouxiangella sp.]|nr:cell division topological specificity factor MinE [Wenzhouxiangella sp.]MCH8477321.1 cell division topological specificity factor MinE [Wenzhouxiangella sp.]TVR94881.1 MAG: cell division topological specificity factor MinE [Wenzhouxiangellaceae bacterium]